MFQIHTGSLKFQITELLSPFYSNFPPNYSRVVHAHPCLYLGIPMAYFAFEMSNLENTINELFMLLT